MRARHVGAPIIVRRGVRGTRQNRPVRFRRAISAAMGSGQFSGWLLNRFDAASIMCLAVPEEAIAVTANELDLMLAAFLIHRPGSP